MKVSDLIAVFEQFAPLHYQEKYDNSGLQIGQIGQEVKAAMLCIDITEEVIEEAINRRADMIISHHPLLFDGLKQITYSNHIEKIVAKVIKNNMVIYSLHTNLDNVYHGVNKKISEKLKLKNINILTPKKNNLKKLVTFVPIKHIEKVRNAVFNAGAGNIGNYNSCSFNIGGEGTFKAGDNTNPFAGEKNKLHFEKEIRLETIFPFHLQKKILNALFEAHPYEEVAYDIYPLENESQAIGSGMIGELDEPVESIEFLRRLLNIFKTKTLRYSNNLFAIKNVKKIALCGGSGGFLIDNALKKNSNIFITGDVKYHDFFKAENKMIIVDIGHYESEQFTTEIFYNLIKEKFPNFAVYFTKKNTNPVKYLSL